MSMANHEKQYTITDMKAILAGFTDVSMQSLVLGYMRGRWSPKLDPPVYSGQRYKVKYYVHLS